MRLAGRPRLAAWIAALAVLLAALAPAISQAVGARQGLDLVEICTAQGSRWVADADRDDTHPVVHALEHCPFCSLHAPVLGVPPAPLHIEPPAGLRDAPPRAFLAAARTPHAWVSAQPRAPPAVS